MRIMDETTGLLLLMLFWILLMAFIFLPKWLGKNTRDSFLVADRSTGIIKGSFAVAAAWIWAPAIFVSSQKAFEQGLPGIIWFTVPNILTLIIFGVLGARVRKLMPDGYTLPQFIKTRFDTKTHLLYLFMFLALQVCSTGVQLLAGSALMHNLTGMEKSTAAIIIASIFLSYTLLRGLKASILTDFMQMCMILGICFVIVPLALYYGGYESFVSGLGGYTGKFTNPFDADVAFNFGIVVTIGLLAGPIGDQQHWQRAFALKKENIGKTYFLSSIIFGSVPIMLSVLGFIGAGMVFSGSMHVNESQMVGYEVVALLLPKSLAIAYVFMVLAGLISTGDSAMCASGSLVSIDFYREYIKKEASDKDIIMVTRVAMILVALGGILISMIPGMKILYLFLFYGTLRACDMMPTILSLYVKSLCANGVFWGIMLAACIGLPLFVLGAVKGINSISVLAAVSVVAISTFVPLLIKK